MKKRKTRDKFTKQQRHEIEIARKRFQDRAEQEALFWKRITERVGGK
jgi:hypothetical protein